MNPVVHSARVTEPKKQDGTMELDVGQIDLLDLPLPPRSKPGMEAAAPISSPSDELRVSKGPPPLPPSAPPAAPAEEEPPVPSLALPQSHPGPSQPHPPAAISARSLAFGPPPKPKSAAVQLAIGMGGATVLCVIAFFAWKATHKTQSVAPAPSASVAPAPTQAFTMAPIEFTTPASSGSAPPEETATASAHASSAAPAPTTTATAKPTATSRTASPAGTSKPPRPDELIKVEN
jgi:hypothetical protein